ncbi:MAG TPA: nodulation protein NfeD [Candidatus Limnocylindrales bacterium]
MARRIARLVASLPPLVPALAVAVAVLAAPTARAAGPVVYVLPTTGVVDGVMASYVRDGIAKASREGAAAVVIELDTPGGSLADMQRISETILGAPLPTIVWVAPSGAWAASAGTFITLAAAVAVMAPGTTIGAASPVGPGGSDITGTEATKVVSAATSLIRSYAEAHGRNADWAASTVERAVSAQASQAVAVHAVDGIAASLGDVLAFADGRTVKVAGRDTTVHVAGATTLTLPMSPWQSALHLLSDADIAFILFVLGAFGLLLELWHPNFLTGIGGGILLVLAFIGFGSLPLNVAGLVLVLLGIALFMAEPSIPSHGALALGGLACFVIGAAALYTEPGPGLPAATVDWPIIAVMAAAAAAFGLVVVRAALRLRRFAPVAIGGISQGGRLEAGQVGEVRSDLAPQGTVYVGGEEWSARAAAGAIARGSRVRVVGQDGLVLVVETIDNGPDGPAATMPSSAVEGGRTRPGRGTA